MAIADFKCTKCGEIITVSKDKAIDNFPEEVKCNKCKGKCKRVWSKVDYDISGGKCGNASNAYNSNMVYQYSNMGKFKGTTVKKI